ncbi:MAG: alpha/beta hydrolase-fold protein [Bacteroidetes bacterium]|nr:alpha/beta hydrolase-fold protein [Bacteroidota bacterium]MDA1121239.1 alpha/beta hydrolase-fold protein [Bacteroidota bacterium]
MKKTILSHLLIYHLLCLLIIASTSLFGQERLGNIVEYFGKEKVEDVSEGKVIHVFKEGLILRITNFGSTQTSVSKHPVFSKFLLENITEIKEGQDFIKDQSGKPSTWEVITAGETNEFRDSGLRSGYLYLEYNAEKEANVLFDASGHTIALINGLPHEGDHYDFGWNLIPIHLRKGKNVFVLEGGRFPNMRARLLDPEPSISFTNRDLTLPDILKEEKGNLLAAIRVMNVNQSWFTGGSISCEVNGVTVSSAIQNISPFNIRKVPFQIPVSSTFKEEKVRPIIRLKNNQGKILAVDTLELNVKSKYDHHKRTFLSDIDGSVQYYSVAPSTTKDQDNQALFFSVHGAAVEAVNQANAYKKKDWGHLVAPTNRRPFGFAWEDWGRLDALEVLNQAEKIFKTDPHHTYLTGHSMGGHGTWYLGATYPDRWAAIAPCAGYPDLLSYRGSFSRRIERMTDDAIIARFGMTRDQLEELMASSGLTDQSDIMLDSIISRAGNPSRTLKLKRNYLHYGVYVLHGEKDTVVPTFIARDMRATLGQFHNDFTYYEYPNGTHWYGDHSVDWPLIFDFFKFRQIKAPNEIDKIEFYTASPGVSAKSHFISIVQQEIPFEISSFNFIRDSISNITTDNIQTIGIDLSKMGNSSGQIRIDDQDIAIADNTTTLYLKKDNNQWEVGDKPSLKEKGPHRNGGFKDAFRNNMVFVYATKGSKQENDWYYNRALFDAEKFWYRANGNVEIIRDIDFSPEKYPDRNVILYGNSDNNSAWQNLLKGSPLQVSNGNLTVGDRQLEGSHWGVLFIYPRSDSDTASIGVVTATGTKGMKAAYANLYLENGSTFPDVMIFDDSVLNDGLSAVKYSRFFGNDWSVENGDFVWRE